jgi:hypothetical protein
MPQLKNNNFAKYQFIYIIMEYNYNYPIDEKEYLYRF